MKSVLHCSEKHPKITTRSTNRYIVLMAGGSGTRMGSDIPKQLMNVGNFPMMVHLFNTAVYMNTPVLLVVSAKNKDVIINNLLNNNHIIKQETTDCARYKYLSNACGYEDVDVYVCVQPVANGTGGALISTMDFFKHRADSNDSVLVLSADVPLITKKTMNTMFDHISDPHSKCCILTKDTTDNFGYGRIVMHDDKFVKIVEQKDCSEQEKQITMINSGVYAFKVGSLMETLPMLTPNNAQKEYYLTDCPKLISDKADQKTVPVKIHTLGNSDSFDETLGANTPEQLERLRAEYLKKFSVEMIDASDINTNDYNLQNLIRILEQLSSHKTTTKIEDIDLDKIREHIHHIAESKINKKHLMVIKYEDQIVGTGSVLIENKLIHDMGRAGHIEDVVVDETFRGLGLAKMLMQRLIGYAKEHGCYKIILDASDLVMPFYEKLGFKRHANNMRLDLA